ncbi:MBL fold metallo-hydrolase [Oceanicola sp. 502str15]|uniref:MBL fold metallo-hydrolase n=1 Tax=Oceanicola sp. 502str15 TaxID=2696061 RepID=UPI002094BD17|nr:MBL fold metallo-hydrolase [Oceanicola sp. 502str15]MCO6384383.1 MBL fold metallo-hydrolase [Oceanicola sp. 502str15]
MDVKPLSFPWETAPAPGEAIEVAEGILWLRLPLPMKLDHVNIFALDEGDSWAVIDTGIGSKESRELWKALIHGPLGGKPIGRIFLTHHHPDHVGNAGWLMQEYGAELWSTRLCWTLTRMLQLDEQARPNEETLQFWRRAGMDPAVYAKRCEERPFNFADITWPLPLGFQALREGQRVQIGGRSWTVHIGNGHAPQHATFWCEDAPLVLGGDQLLPSISPNLGVYASEPDADPVGEWLESCARLGAFARDDQLVLPGHKLPFTGLPARLVQMADNHHTALARLLEHLAETPGTAHDVFEPVFGRRIEGDAYGLALAEAVGHVNHLYATGRVSREPGEDDAWIYRVV